MSVRKIRPAWLLGISAVAVAAAVPACQSNSPTYFEPASPLEVGQPGSMATSASGMVAVTFRPPDGDEAAKLDEESAGRPVRAAWIRRNQVAVQVQYTLRNLSDKPAVARLFVDGASEFASYDAAALRGAALMAGDDEAVYFSLIQTGPIELAPGASKRGIIREDEFAEAALDLDAIGRFMAEPTSVLINRSEVNPVGLEMVPPEHIVPQLVSVKVSVSANAHVRLEFLVRVRDEKGVLQEGADGMFAPQPRAYMPAAMMMMTPPMMMPMPARMP